MKFLPTPLSGAWIVELEPVEDERGFFARTYCREEFARHGLNPALAQCGTSFNRVRGTLRGMHYQAAPHEEAKLVRCVRGAIHDVIVDLRAGSLTRHRWFGLGLDADSHRMLYVPEGFAHGFQTLEDDTEVSYHISNYYVPEAAAGIRYDDPDLAIPWPLAVSRVADRDRSWPTLAQLQGAAAASA